MNKFTKALALGALLVSAGGAGVAAWADTAPTAAATPTTQDCPGGRMHGGMMGRHHGPHAGGFGDPAARLASLKTDIGIRPEQQAAWDAYAKVLQDTAQQMRAQHEGMDRKALHAMAPADRETAMATMHQQRAQAFTAVGQAAQALLPSLDDAQKAKAKTELPGLATPHMRHAGMERPAGSPTPNKPL